MKPVKNRIFCDDCGHTKIFFESYRKAMRYLALNADEVERETGKRSVRAYYCRKCYGWHVTSRPHSFSRRALQRRFGSDEGGRMYDTVRQAIGSGTSIIRGLGRKVKDLKHTLRYEFINVDKCLTMIQSLIDLFEIIIKASLEKKENVDKLFKKFSSLCNIFIQKKQLVTIA